MGKIVAYPNKKLNLFLRGLLLLSIGVLVVSLVKFVLTSFDLFWIVISLLSLVLFVFLFMKSVLQAVYFVIDDSVLYVYRSRVLLSSCKVSDVEFVSFSNAKKSYRGLKVVLDQQVYTLSNLEYDGFEAFEKVARKSTKTLV
jgi:hypothetical protein